MPPASTPRVPGHSGFPRPANPQASTMPRSIGHHPIAPSALGRVERGIRLFNPRFLCPASRTLSGHQARLRLGSMVLWKRIFRPA
jgi:hypothetical protein